MNVSKSMNLATTMTGNGSISLKDYYLGYLSPLDTPHIIYPRYSPYVVILQGNNYTPLLDNNYSKLGTACDPNAFIEILVTLLNLFCYLPGYCYDNNNSAISTTNLPNLNITSADVIWKWYPAGVSKMYMKLLVLLPNNQSSVHKTADPHSFIPTFVIQSVLSRMNDIIEARLGCQVINPLKTSYTYAFWVLPLLASFLFMLILSAVILIYHVWDPRIEQKIKAKWLDKEEGTKLIHNFTVIPEGLEEIYFGENNNIPPASDSSANLKESISNGGDLNPIDKKSRQLELSRI